MNKTLVVGAIAVVLLVFALGGFFLWQDVRNQVSHTPASEQQTPPPPPAPSPQAETEVLDTSSWQTYRSDEFGFEVKYPANLTATSTKLKYIQEWTGEFYSYPAASPFDRVSFSDQKNKSTLSISIISYPSENDLSKENYTKGYLFNNDIFGPCESRAGFESSSIEEMKILGRPMLIVQGTYIFPELGKTVMCAYLKNKANNILVMESEDFSLLNQILSTFRFVE